MGCGRVFTRQLSCEYEILKRRWSNICSVITHYQYRILFSIGEDTSLCVLVPTALERYAIMLITKSNHMFRIWHRFLLQVNGWHGPDLLSDLVDGIQVMLGFFILATSYAWTLELFRWA